MIKVKEEEEINRVQLQLKLISSTFRKYLQRVQVLCSSGYNFTRGFKYPE